MPRSLRKMPYEERMELYRKAMKLKAERNWGRRRIARELDISSGTVAAWLYHNIKPRKKQGKIEVKCGYCGKLIRRWPFEVRKYPNSCCNSECRAKWVSKKMRGENHPQWKGLEKDRIELYEKGLSDVEMAKQLEISRESIRNWRHSRELSRNHPLGRTPKPFDFSPTRNLGYLCGLVMGDGWLSQRAVHLSTRSREFREIVADTIKSVGLHPTRFERVRDVRVGGKLYSNKTFYCVLATSKNLFEALHPCKQKGIWEIPPFLATNESLLGFLQGIYDSDGSVNSSGYQHSVTLTSGRRENLLKVSGLLHKFGIHPTNIYKHRTSFDLVIGRKRDVFIFAQLIGFKLSWKKEKLKEALGRN